MAKSHIVALFFFLSKISDICYWKITPTRLLPSKAISRAFTTAASRHEKPTRMFLKRHCGHGIMGKHDYKIPVKTVTKLIKIMELEHNHTHILTHKDDKAEPLRERQGREVHM